MADITGFNSGEVANEGLQNWRGDQVAAPQGGQSVFKSSSVQLAPLGSRKVVGDRVFRYAKLGAIATVPGDLLQCNLAENMATAGGTDPAGGKVFTFFHTASAAAADLYAEGYVYSQSGTAANLGQIYRIRTHAAISQDTNGSLYLYDPLTKQVNVTDEWAVVKNPYNGVTQCTAGTAPIAGVLACPATTNDYVWIQTWGPCAVKAQTAAGGGNVMYAAATGAVKGFIATGTGGTVYAQIGQFSGVPTASDTTLGFLQIAP